jgi:hypothetical protein
MSLSNEACLLIACARGEAIDLSRPINWDTFLDLAAANRLLPLTYQHAEHFPAEVRTQLAEAHQYHAWRGLRLAGQLITLLDLLSPLPVMPLKGPILAQQAYGSFALRPSVDLDILIHERDLTQATAQLEAAGYRRIPDQSGRYDLKYLLPDHDIRVELHWALTHDDLHGLLDASFLWQHQRTVMFQQHEVRVPSPEATLLYLCAHGYKDRWRRFFWVVDVAKFIESTPDIQWDKLLTSAKQAGVYRVLLVGLRLAWHWMGAPLPLTIQQAVERDRHVIDLANGFSVGLREEQVMSTWEKMLFHFKMRHRFRDQAAYLWRTASDLIVKPHVF